MGGIEELKSVLRTMGDTDRIVPDSKTTFKGKTWNGRQPALLDFVSKAQNKKVWAKLREAIRTSDTRFSKDIANEIIGKFDTNTSLSSRKALKILEAAEFRAGLFGQYGQNNTKKAIQNILRSDQPILLSEANFDELYNIDIQASNLKKVEKLIDSDEFWDHFKIPKPEDELYVKEFKKAVRECLADDKEFLIDYRKNDYIIGLFDENSPNCNTKAQKILFAAKTNAELIRDFGENNVKLATQTIFQSDNLLNVFGKFKSEEGIAFNTFLVNLKSIEETFDSEQIWLDLNLPPSIAQNHRNEIKDEVMKNWVNKNEIQKTILAKPDLLKKLKAEIRSTSSYKKIIHQSQTFLRLNNGYQINGKQHTYVRRIPPGKSGARLAVLQESDPPGKKSVFKYGDNLAWGGETGKAGISGEKDFYEAIGGKSGNHKNIVGYRGFVEADIFGSGKGGGGMLLEYVPGMNLDELQKELNKSNDPKVLLVKKYIAAQCLEGLKYINQKGMVMWDFDNYNCRVRNDGVVKLYDFDMGRPLTPENSKRDITKFVKMLSSDDYFGKHPDIMEHLKKAKDAESFDDLVKICNNFLLLNAAEEEDADDFLSDLISEQ